MSDNQLLLLGYSAKTEATQFHDLKVHPKQYHTLSSRTDLIQYISLSRKIADRWHEVNEPRSRGWETNYLTLLEGYQAYGAGYIDAARRYRNDAFFEISRLNTSNEISDVHSQNVRYSRLSFFYFTTFVVLMAVSIVAGTRGFFSSSHLIVEFAVFSFATSLCAGLAWLKRAEIDLRSVRYI
jgi:hypothetical protein